jgi:hypothetical protein
VTLGSKVFIVFNSKKVSQERVMGISFVDILIQAVFLLLLILMVGYVDPVEQIKFEFYEAGKDLCNKINKDTPQACVEYLKDKDIKVGSKEKEPSEDFCKKRNLSREECKSKLDELAANISLWPCIPPSSKSQLTVSSTLWTIHAPGQIEFNRFSDEYLAYLNRKGFAEIKRRVDAIKASAQKFYTPSDISSTFGFLREETCFHEYLVERPGKFSDSDLRAERQALRALKGFSN